MPPRWSRKPDRADPDYRRLDDRMNFATHVAIFAASNSGLWFFRLLGTNAELSAPGGLPWAPWITGIWALLLLVHGVFVFAIARYPEIAETPTTAGTGFKPKSSKPTAKSTGR